MYAKTPFNSLTTASLTYLLQVHEFEENQSVVPEELVAPDDAQVGEEGPEGPQAEYPVQDEVPPDLPQLREAVVPEVLRLVVLEEHDAQVAHDQGTAPQLPELLEVVADVDGAADLRLDGDGGPQEDEDETW